MPLNRTRHSQPPPLLSNGVDFLGQSLVNHTCFKETECHIASYAIPRSPRSLLNLLASKWTQCKLMSGKLSGVMWLSCILQALFSCLALFLCPQVWPVPGVGAPLQEKAAAFVPTSRQCSLLQYSQGPSRGRLSASMPFEFCLLTSGCQPVLNF